MRGERLGVCPGRGAGLLPRLLMVVVVALMPSAAPQAWQARDAGQPTGTTPILVESAAPGDAAVLRFYNRDIVTLRARVAGRPPAERVEATLNRLYGVLDSGIDGEVVRRPSPAGIGLAYARRGAEAPLLLVTPLDVDTSLGATLEDEARRAAEALAFAIGEYRAQHDVRQLAQGGVWTLFATGLFGALVLGLGAVRRALTGRLARGTAGHLRDVRLAGYTLLDSRRLRAVASRIVSFLAGAAMLGVTYGWLTFVLRQFPYTRPWGEALSGYLRALIGSFGLAIAGAIPNLFAISVIVFLTRAAIGVANGFFRAVEAGRVRPSWVYPETAMPTRRIVSLLLWLFALVMAYPFIPGSDTDAFKGIGALVGLLLSFGSAGVMGQVISGLVLIYSRALKPGEFVQIGETEGTVESVDLLATRLRTRRHEAITIPNAVVIGNTTKNFTRLGRTHGLIVPTSVTIGYDTPWRQVHGLLVEAAGRTTGVRTDPRPYVLQTALSDFYVEYQLNVALERPDDRAAVLDTLHANIQDVFNEHGVPILSPHYESEPPARPARSEA